MRWILVAGAAAAVGGCARCDLEHVAERLAGPDAVACGEVGACLEEAMIAGEPAWTVQWLPGIDSQVGTATVWTGEDLWQLGFDSDPSGGSGTGAVVYGTLSCAGLDVARDGTSCPDPEPVCAEQLCGPGAGRDSPCP